MAYMDSEADLAGVIGHEIGHVTARHGRSARRASRRPAVGVLAATMLGAVLESQGVAGARRTWPARLRRAWRPATSRRYSREQELQADQLGAEYLARNQYDPHNMVDVIQVLKNQERFAADAARSRGPQRGVGARQLAGLAPQQRRAAGRTSAQIAPATKASYGDDGRDALPAGHRRHAFGRVREQGVMRGAISITSRPGLRVDRAARGWEVQNTARRARDRERRRRCRAGRAAGAGQGRQHTRGDHPQLPSRTQGASIAHDAERACTATHFVGTRATAQGQTQRIELTVVTGPGGRNYLLVLRCARRRPRCSARRRRCAKPRPRFAR